MPPLSPVSAFLDIGGPTLSGEAFNTTSFPFLSDANWAVIGLNPALLADPGSADRTTAST